MSLLNKTYKILFLIGVFFIPFNSFEGLSFLGEFRNEAAAFFFIGGFILLFVGVFLKHKITIPIHNPILQIFGVFLLWCLITTIINLPTVYSNYFKETGGINRFIRQYISLLISSVAFFLFYWNVIRKMSVYEILYSIRKVFLFSLIVATVYGILEIAILIFNIPAAYPILRLFNYFPFLEVKVYGDRISSVSYEPPFLAIYLITIAGWMFSYILTEKGIKKFIPLILILLLTFFSGSRTALIVIFIQLLGFLSFLAFSKKYRKYAFIFLGSGFLVVTILGLVNSKEVVAEVEKKIESLDFKTNLTESVSNKSRWGIQYASLQVFKEHPITGVGFGQQTYHSRLHYPVWATSNNYEFRLIYKNQKISSFPPGYNLYLRIMTETGIIGLVIYLLFLIMIYKKSYQLIRENKGEMKILAMVLFISFLGFGINFLQIDTFRLYGFWICLAILLHLSYLSKLEKET